MIYLLRYFLFLTLSLHFVMCIMYHMSMNGMRDLLELEAELGKSFLDYYREETRRLENLESLLNEFDKQNTGEHNDYVYNPVDAYKLLKRFTRGWNNISKYQRPKFEPEVMKRYHKFVNRVPGFNDLSEEWGSIYAIIKLQETYKIEVTDFTEKYKHSQKLQALDIFLIGYHAMSHGYFAISALWLEEICNRYYAGVMKETELSPYNMTLVFQSIIWDYDRVDDWEAATYYSKLLWEYDPHAPYVKTTYDWYKYKFDWSTTQPKDPDESRFGDLSNRPWLQRNNVLCRREEKMRQSDVDKLHCSYYSPSYEFLLKPFKMEMAFHDPLILYFHDLLSEAEVDHLIIMGRLVLSVAEQAEVYSMETGKIGIANYRIGKVGWMSGEWDPIVERITKRVGYLTGLDMEWSEPLQVMNYGIGGNYEAHYDHATPPHNYTIFGNYAWGNRIGTMLLYLSNVEKGGETVFTNTAPGIITSARKGAAVLWYNLHRNGTGDYRTKHAGCPVILGEKWVANLWIHEWYQEFKRKCTTNPYE